MGGIEKKEARKLIRNSVDARRGFTFIEVGALIIVSVGIVEGVTRFFMQSNLRLMIYCYAIFVVLLCYGLYIMIEGVGSIYRVYQDYDSYEFCESVPNRISYDGQRAYLDVVVLKENGETVLFKTCPIYSRNNILSPDADDYYGKHVLTAYNRVTDRCIVVRIIEDDIDDGIINRYI